MVVTEVAGLAWAGSIWPSRACDFSLLSCDASLALQLKAVFAISDSKALMSSKLGLTFGSCTHNSHSQIFFRQHVVVCAFLQ